MAFSFLPGHPQITVFCPSGIGGVKTRSPDPPEDVETIPAAPKGSSGQSVTEGIGSHRTGPQRHPTGAAFPQEIAIPFSQTTTGLRDAMLLGGFLALHNVDMWPTLSSGLLIERLMHWT